MREDSNQIQQSKILPRNKIPPQYRWDIDSLYKKEEDWQEDCLKVEELLAKLPIVRPNFTQDANSLLIVLKLRDEISELLQKIYTYAHMRKDENNNNSLYQSLFNKASALLAKVEESLSFIKPGVLSLKYCTLKKWIRENSQIKVYQHYLEDICRRKDHVLSGDSEQIIARSGEFAQVFEYVFELLSYADLRFPKFKDEKGENITLSHGNFTTLLRRKNRRFRQKVYQKYFKEYRQHSNTYAALLAGNIKKDHFYSSVRNYKDCLTSALFKDNIPVKVYGNLIDTVHQNIGLLHEYISLKCDYLHLDKLAMYDMYVPLIEENLTFSYPRAQTVLLESLKPLGENYLAIVQKGLEERWVDVYENQGKTSGAYSTGSYRSKPFILMNYQDTMEDVYTLAHEFGHSVHSYLAHEAQPFIYSDVSIFLAEIASTTNEVLLTSYLLENMKDESEKIISVNHFLEQFRTTFFRQVMFAEFELLLHQAQANGVALTADFLCQKYAELNRFYYGENVIIDREISMEWARIPHFFYNYYVYQYATGFAVATALSRQIIQEGTAKVKKYLEFLKAGSSDYPFVLLKKIGIDPTVPNYLEEALSLFSELLQELQKI